MNKNIQLIDLQAQQETVREKIDLAVKKVLDHGKYIMGPEVSELETMLQEFCGAKHAVTCSNGTDALAMVLMAKNIGPGDAVICPSFTFTATPEVIALLGATPVFCDVDLDTFNMNSEKLQDAIDLAKKSGLTPKAIIAVDLFGQPADYEQILDVANANNIWVLSDAAQSFGATYKGKGVGTFGLATATSFFPAKPLGCYGDGGAIFTDDDNLADVLKSIRVHGKGTDKYDNVRVGLNARLDTIQAAILIEKLKIFPWEIDARNAVADTYKTLLGNCNAITPPVVAENRMSVWAQYTIRLNSDSTDRDALATHLKQKGIPTAVYYPKPLHQQTAYQGFVYNTNAVRNSEMLSQNVLSLPMHPYLAKKEQEYVCETLLEFFNHRV